MFCNMLDAPFIYDTNRDTCFCQCVPGHEASRTRTDDEDINPRLRRHTVRECLLGRRLHNHRAGAVLERWEAEL